MNHKHKAAQQLTEIVSQITKRREAMKLSRYALANMTELPESTIFRIEKETVRPQLDTILIICSALKVKLRFEI